MAIYIYYGLFTTNKNNNMGNRSDFFWLTLWIALPIPSHPRREEGARHVRRLLDFAMHAPGVSWRETQHGDRWWAYHMRITVVLYGISMYIIIYIHMMDMLYRYVGILFFTIYITIEWGCNLCNCSVFWQNCWYFQRYSSSYSLDELETPPIVSNCQILSSYFDYWDCDFLNTIHDDCCSTPKSQIDAYIHIDQEIPRVTKIDIKDHKHR